MAIKRFIETTCPEINFAILREYIQISPIWIIYVNNNLPENLCTFKLQIRQSQKIVKVPTFRGPESLIDSFGGSHSRSVYPPIKEQHNKHWNVKGPECGINDITNFTSKLASTSTAGVVGCYSLVLRLKQINNILDKLLLSCRH